MASSAFAQQIRTAAAATFNGAAFVNGIDVARNDSTIISGPGSTNYILLDTVLTNGISDPGTRTVLLQGLKVTWGGGDVFTATSMLNAGGSLSASGVTVFGAPRTLPVSGFDTYTSPSFPGMSVLFGAISGQSFDGISYGAMLQINGPAGIPYRANYGLVADSGQTFSGGGTAPEPGTLALLTIGIVAGICRRNRK